MRALRSTRSTRPLGVDPEQIESLVHQMETELRGSKFCVEDGVLTRRSESLSDSEFGKQVAGEGLDWLKSATDLTNAQETVELTRCIVRGSS